MTHSRLLLWLLAAFCSTALTAQSAETVSIPAKGSISISPPDAEQRGAKINTMAVSALDVASVDTENGKTVSSFGLGAGKPQLLSICPSCELVLTNTSDSPKKATLSWVKMAPKDPQPKKSYVSISLTNTSSRSIPLLIPGVMNPNLSPKSRSGVSLKMGQEILFKYKGKRRVLLTVDESLSSGDTIEISGLIKERKAELDAM